MGLFGRKKEELEKELPDFSKKDEFPAYESEFKLPERDFQQDIPSNTPAGSSLDRFKMPFEETPRLPSEFRTEIQEPVRPEVHEDVLRPYSSEKPLFIKVENFKEALESIDSIKSKLKEAEVLLNRLENLKAEEDQEIKRWHDHIESIKNKLLAADKKLFES